MQLVKSFYNPKSYFMLIFKHYLKTTDAKLNILSSRTLEIILCYSNKNEEFIDILLCNFYITCENAGN